MALALALGALSAAAQPSTSPLPTARPLTPPRSPLPTLTPLPLACRGSVRAATPRPAVNFIFALADDWGWGDVGFNGPVWDTRPHT